MVNIKDVLRFLHSPETVVKFQQLCGLKRLEYPTCASGNDDLHSGINIINNDVMSPATNALANTTLQRRSLVACSSSTCETRPSGIDKNGVVPTDSTYQSSESTFHNSSATSSKSSGSNYHTVSPLAYRPPEARYNGVSYYVVRHHWIDFLFHFGAQLGNEIFYITFFPFWFWNIDGYVGRRLCMFWCAFMYTGQALKDILKIPRPAAPPVVRLERRYELEYGMPSTHAMVGAGIPFSIYFLTLERYNYDSEWMLIGALVWCSLVGCSRIYLGMHSILDVIGGIFLVFLLMILIFPFIDAVDDFVLHSTWSPLACTLFPLVACILYPTPALGNTARGDTALIMAVGAGISIGHWFSFQYGYMTKSSSEPPYDIIQPTWTWAGLVVIRMTLGVTFLLALRTALKAVVHMILRRLFVVDIPLDISDETTEDKEEDDRRRPRMRDERKPWCIELPTKFVTYSVLTASCVVCVPIIFRYIGIERETYFTEI